MFISELLKAKLAKEEKKSEAIFFHFAINKDRAETKIPLAPAQPFSQD